VTGKTPLNRIEILRRYIYLLGTLVLGKRRYIRWRTELGKVLD
jgi:hypothetical protein